MLDKACEVRILSLGVLDNITLQVGAEVRVQASDFGPDQMSSLALNLVAYLLGSAFDPVIEICEPCNESGVSVTLGHL